MSSNSNSNSSSSNNGEEGRSKASAWREQVKQVQIQKATPEIIASMRDAAERQRHASIARERCETLSRTNYIASACNARTMTAFSAMSSSRMGGGAGGSARPAPEAAAEYLSIQTESSSRLGMLDHIVTSMSSAPAAPVCKEGAPMKAKKVFSATPGMAAGVGGGTRGTVFSLRSVAREEDDSDEDEAEIGESERALRSVEADLGITYNATVSANVHQQQREMATVVASNMRTLESEPTDPAEATAKFALFEDASKTVTTIREQTLKFWVENQASFPGKSGEECVRDIAKIDSQDAMGIQDNPRVWFIYGMTKKCNDNSVMINDLLSKFRNRLDLLLQELGDCPFCLNTLTHETACALGCCHRVCSDCWDNWVELKGNGAFCPLCRHREFIDEIAS